MKMKPYKAEAVNSGIFRGWATLTCPRRGCGGEFVVDRKPLKEAKAKAGVKTVACPYCSRVSLIPDRVGKG